MNEKKELRFENVKYFLVLASVPARFDENSLDFEIPSGLFHFPYCSLPMISLLIFFVIKSLEKQV